MIQELLDLSYQLDLTGNQAFAPRPVHWFIDLDRVGRFLGVVPTVSSAGASRGNPVPESALLIECPVSYFAMVKPQGVVASGGGGRAVAELGAGNISEVFGVLIERNPGGAPHTVQLPDKDAYKHANFRDLHRQLADAARQNLTIQAVWQFLSRPVSFPVAEFSVPQLAKLPGQQFSFRVEGRLLLTDRDLRRWWRLEFARQRASVEDCLPAGRDLFPHAPGDPCTGVLTPVFPHIAVVPGGGPWCPLASFDKAPFQSYGLAGSTLPMRLETAERSAAVLNRLLRDESSHLRLGNSVAVFWAVSAGDSSLPSRVLDFIKLLEHPDPLQVRMFLSGAWDRCPRGLAEGRFHAAILSSPRARITVRGWHTATLSRVRDHLQRWFAFIAVPAQSGPGEIYPALAQLGACTVRSDKDTGPGTFTALWECALFGSAPLPRPLLAQALRRQALELASDDDRSSRAAFERRLAARTALFQLFVRPSATHTMRSAPVDLETNVAYNCGRLLAQLDLIHNVAYSIKDGASTSPATRAYAAASTAPAVICPQLCQRARYHLKQIGGGLAHRLEYGRKEAAGDGLCSILESVCAAGSEFPQKLPLEDQGRFAIGFFAQRSRRWTNVPKTADETADETTVHTTTEE